MNIGWVLVPRMVPDLARLLQVTGFRRAYRADGVQVYRRAP